MQNKLAAELLEAADILEKLSRSEIQILLRRAALRIDGRLVPAGVSLIPEIRDLADDFAKEHDMSLDEAVNAIMLDWAISMGMIEVDDLDEDDG